MASYEKLIPITYNKTVMVAVSGRHKRTYLALGLIILVTCIYVIYSPEVPSTAKEYNNYYVASNIEQLNIFEEYERSDYKNGKWRDLSDSEIGNMSTMGRILFLDEIPPNPAKEKTFKILVWKYGKTIENRHMKQYTDKFVDPFESCSVHNCEVTYEDDAIHEADLVMFHMHRMKGVADLPKGPRNPDQIWAFTIDESPYNIFLDKHHNKIEDYNNVFNWSMSYRMSSDIPVPYGRTVPLDVPDETLVDDLNTWLSSKKRKPKIAVLGSNCGSKNHRWEYVNKLKQHIPVDVYGKCGPLECKGHFNQDCNLIDQYMFYLAFENSNCEEYLTEKVFWNAYHKNAIPIIMGAPGSNLAKLLPPRSYLNVEDFATPRDLAVYIDYLLSHPTELQIMFQWKKYFKVEQEHGYFQSKSYHYCRICEALNYNSYEQKTYDHLESDWGLNKCYSRWDETD